MYNIENELQTIFLLENKKELTEDDIELLKLKLEKVEELVMKIRILLTPNKVTDLEEKLQTIQYDLPLQMNSKRKECIKSQNEKEKEIIDNINQDNIERNSTEMNISENQSEFITKSQIVCDNTVNIKEEKENQITPVSVAKISNKKSSPTDNQGFLEMLERMQKYSSAKASKVEEKRKQIANELLSKNTLSKPVINEKSRKLVIKDFFTRQEDFKISRESKKKEIKDQIEEKIKRDLTPKMKRKKIMNTSIKTIEESINDQFKWESERKQKIESFRKRENSEISRECTFTPRINRNSDHIAKKLLNKSSVTSRLYTQDRLLQRNKFLSLIDNNTIEYHSFNENHH